ncbi:MAG: hypothetical protein H5U40_10965, partial [Polyangiaceae bacterium]|nr:hypothetical protein [Polyangiaceae bacterium]
MLALSAFFLAQGTTGLAAATLLPLRAAPAPTGSPAGARAPRRERTSDEHILRRNIFDPSTGDVFAEPLVATGEPEAETVVVVPWEPGQPTEACAGPGIRLVGAVVSPNAPEWSFAALTAEGTPKAMLYRRGMSVRSNEILQVERDRVVVRPSSGAACHVAMFGADAPAAAPVAAAAPPSEPAAADAEGGITRISDTEFTVDRSLVAG